jgi:hypothetical protein
MHKGVPILRQGRGGEGVRGGDSIEEVRLGCLLAGRHLLMSLPSDPSWSFCESLAMTLTALSAAAVHRQKECHQSE